MRYEQKGVLLRGLFKGACGRPAKAAHARAYQNGDVIARRDEPPAEERRKESEGIAWVFWSCIIVRGVISTPVILNGGEFYKNSLVYT